MNTLRTLLCLLMLASTPVFAHAASHENGSDAASAQAITVVLSKSVDDWNRGDLDAFASSYKNATDILFMGRTISTGYAQMLARYKASYPTPETMGKLSFSQLDIQPLDATFATVTGHFHLDRTVAGGSNVDGYFLLVVEHTAQGWKIVRDDTTVLPPPTK